MRLTSINRPSASSGRALRTAEPIRWSVTEQVALDRLRVTFGAHCDIFGDREIARLRFVRYLIAKRALKS